MLGQQREECLHFLVTLVHIFGVVDDDGFVPGQFLEQGLKFKMAFGGQQVLHK